MKKIKALLRILMRSFSVVCALFFCIIFMAACSLPRDHGLDADILSYSDETEFRKRARIRLELASNYFESGQVAVALDETKQALATDPNYADGYNLLGLIYMHLSDFDKAGESFRRALNLRPLDSNVIHNYAWLLCSQEKYSEADKYFNVVLSSKSYAAVSKTLMAKGLCQLAAKNYLEAEKTLINSYKVDASNPIVAYNLAFLLFRRSEFSRAQFYIRRLNNSEMANSETLWLGVKIERALSDDIAMRQLADQLRKRFPDSRESSLYESGKFND